MRVTQMAQTVAQRRPCINEATQLLAKLKKTDGCRVGSD